MLTPKRLLVIAPHPDDETLGCGGTLLRFNQESVQLAWLIITNVKESYGYSSEFVTKRQQELLKVAEYYNFKKTYNLNLPPAKLETFALGDIIQKISEAITDYQPDTLLIPHQGDIHSDHRVVFNATLACSKWFRYPSIKQILSYETLSETDFALVDTFKPNVFINIENYLTDKLAAMRLYESELGQFPFPRSEQTIEALAKIRGSQAGYQAAEAFTLLKAIYS